MSTQVKNFKCIRYWGRKPPLMVSKYIEEFTDKGELVLDPFGGSGNIVRTALALQRKAIYVDLNPFAKLIAEASILGSDPEKLKMVLEKILSEKYLNIINKEGKIIKVNKRLLFSIKCSCGKPVEVNSVAFTRIYEFKYEPKHLTNLQEKVLRTIYTNGPVNHENLIQMLSYIPQNAITNALKRLIKNRAVIEKVVPLKVTYVRPCTCGRTKIYEPSNLQWMVKGPIHPAYWYPRAKLRYPNGEPFLKKRDVERVDEFFTDRTLAFLAYLWHKIKKVNSSSIKRSLYLIFMATLIRSSKMNRESGGTWPINSYWIPRHYLIRNPLYTFIRAANDVLRSLSSRSYQLKNGSVSKVLKGEADLALFLSDATNLPLPNYSVDYVITDPPHTDEAQFFELSVFYTSWLRKKLDFEREFIINSKQGKKLKDYLEMYAKFVLEVKRILKPSRFLTVILHEENEKILKKCLEITQDHGFSLCKSERIGDFYFFTFRSERESNQINLVRICHLK